MWGGGIANEKCPCPLLKLTLQDGHYLSCKAAYLAVIGKNDEDEAVRNVAVNKILKLRGNTEDVTNRESDLFDRNFRGGFLNIGDDDDDVVEREEVEIRAFKIPTINTRAKIYYKLTDMSDKYITEPPILMNYSDADVVNLRTNRLILDHPCHSQAVERMIKVVSESSSQVVGFERRDGHIRQTLKSRHKQKNLMQKKTSL